MNDRLTLTEPRIVIVGAGPVGLSLALGLARHGVRSVLIDREEGPSEHSRAAGVHLRTLEIFRRWKVEHDLLTAGTLVDRITVVSTTDGRPLVSYDFSELSAEADRPGMLMLEQGKTERILLQAVRDSGMCDVRWRTEAVGLEADSDSVALTTRHEGETSSLTAPFLVGCDGASSFVRKALGLPFDGITYSIRPMLADVRVDPVLDRLRWPRLYDRDRGLTVGIRIAPGLWRIIRLEDGPAPDEVSEEEVRRHARAVLGADPDAVVWASRFRIHRRHAPTFRKGCVLLAGDAAHVHSPVGGQGMNAGVQDAQNLAWKLAGALRGGDSARLLDSYDVERRAVAAESVSRFTNVVTRVFLQSPSALRRAAFAALRWLLRIRRVRLQTLRALTMIGLDYPPSPLLDPGDRAAGIRLPDLELRSPSGDAVRLHTLLPVGPALIEVGDPGSGGDLAGCPVISVGPQGFEDPRGTLRDLLGGEDGWILVRPDGHVAWARREERGIDAALRRALGETFADRAP